MREIKFRAWDGKQMQTDFNLFSDGGAFSIDAFEEIFRHENWIIMQFTGLKDKNGKDIYEGDVVTTNGGHPAEVIWQSYIAKFLLQSLEEGRSYLDWFERRYERDFEVIGNIHETPELLK